MFELRTRSLPVGKVLKSASALVLRLGVGASLLMLGACASRQAHYRVSPQNGAVSYQNVRVAGYQRAAHPTEIEDDGIEAQAAPRARRHVEPDDPSEPFSPNYGTQQVFSDPDDHDDAAGVGSDAFDPFLDGPQWKRDRAANREEVRADVVGSYLDSSEPAGSTQVAVAARRLRPGFREKRVLRLRR